VGVGRGDAATEVNAIPVSWDFTRVLGLQPVIGRHFEESDSASVHKIAWLSYGLWQQRFGGSTTALGSELQTDEGAFLIAGVLPDDFIFPSQLGLRADVIFADKPAAARTERRFAIARLAGGQALSAAQAEAEVIAIGLSTQTGSVPASSLRLSPLRDAMFQLKSAHLILLFGASVLVLGVACLNASILASTNALSRMTTTLVRESLGATRGKMLMDAAVESVLLGIIGGAAGLGLVYAISKLTLAMAPVPIFSALPLGMDWRIASFVMVASTMAAALCGCAPLLLTNRETSWSLRQAGAVTATRNTSRSLKVLIAGQAACGLVVLTLSWVSLSAFADLRISTLGFVGTDVSVIDLQLPPGRYKAPQAIWQLHYSVIDQLGDGGAKTEVAAIDSLPMSGAMPERRYQLQPDAPAIGVYRISDRFFQVLDVPLIQGRAFTAEESFTNAPIAMVNQAAARLLISKESIGSQSVLIKGDDTERQIVGVVANTRAGFGETPAPAIYVPFDPQRFRRMTLITRSRGEGGVARGTVSAIAGRVDPELRFRMVPLTDLVNRSVAQEKLQAFALSLFAVLTLGLLTAGLHCTARHVAATRLSEVAIRLSYGATPADIRLLLLQQTVAPVLGGVVIGAGLSWFAVRSLSQVMPGLGAPDLRVVAGGAMWLLLLSTLVCLLASRRASHSSPIALLRQA
jgi:predicted permease